MGALVEQHGELKFRRSFLSYLPLFNLIYTPIFFSILFGDKLLEPSFHVMWIIPVVTIVTFGSFFLIGLYLKIQDLYLLYIISFVG